MSLSVIEVLLNAKFNIENASVRYQTQLAVQQLSNAIEQLQRNPDANAEYEESEDVE